MVSKAKSTRGPGDNNYKPTDEEREKVRSMTAAGITQNDICAVLNITVPTLHKHYRREIDASAPEANHKVACSLFEMATEGKNVSAAIFWLKTRARWSEARPEEEHKESGVTITVTGGLPRRTEE